MIPPVFFGSSREVEALPGEQGRLEFKTAFAHEEGDYGHREDDDR